MKTARKTKPGPRERKEVYLLVTSQVLYFYNDGEINGWTPEQVIEDWFHRFKLGSYHATRDTHRIGNSDKLVKVKVLNKKELAKHLQGGRILKPVTTRR